MLSRPFYFTTSHLTSHEIPRMDKAATEGCTAGDVHTMRLGEREREGEAEQGEVKTPGGEAEDGAGGESDCRVLGHW